MREHLWEGRSTGVVCWLPSFVIHRRLSVFGWRIVTPGNLAHSIHDLAWWGFKIMSTEQIQFNEKATEIQLIDFNPSQFRNATDEGDGLLTAYNDPEKISVGHPPLIRFFGSNALSSLVSQKPIDVVVVEMVEGIIVGFHVCTAIILIHRPLLTSIQVPFRSNITDDKDILRTPIITMTLRIFHIYSIYRLNICDLQHPTGGARHAGVGTL